MRGPRRSGPDGSSASLTEFVRLEQLRPRGFNAFILDRVIWLVSTQWDRTEVPDRQTITCINTVTGTLKRFTQGANVKPIHAVTIPENWHEVDPDLGGDIGATITERAAHIARLIDRITEDDDGTQ